MSCALILPASSVDMKAVSLVHRDDFRTRIVLVDAMTILIVKSPIFWRNSSKIYVFKRNRTVNVIFSQQAQ